MINQSVTKNNNNTRLKKIDCSLNQYKILLLLNKKLKM